MRQCLICGCKGTAKIRTDKTFMKKNVQKQQKSSLKACKKSVFVHLVYVFCYLCSMLEKTKGIVLHSIRYGDDNMIVSVYCQHRGTLTFMVRVPKSKHAKVKAQLLRPLSILDLDIDYRDRVQMQRIHDMHVALHYTSLPYEPVKEALAMFLGEVLYYALKREGQNLDLYDFLENSLQWLDLTEKDYANFHICLLIQLTRFLGFFPNVDEIPAHSLFDLVEGSFVRVIPFHGQYLTEEESLFMGKLLKMNFLTMHRVHLNRAQRGRVLRILNMYYRIHVPDFPELKSLDVLTELFD